LCWDCELRKADDVENELREELRVQSEGLEAQARKNSELEDTTRRQKEEFDLLVDETRRQNEQLQEHGASITDLKEVTTSLNKSITKLGNDDKKRAEELEKRIDDKIGRVERKMDKKVVEMQRDIESLKLEQEKVKKDRDVEIAQIKADKEIKMHKMTLSAGISPDWRSSNSSINSNVTTRSNGNMQTSYYSENYPPDSPDAYKPGYFNNRWTRPQRPNTTQY
jgi:predicted ribosome quality control (RQC) complex YloA/Tae2 family protein